MAPKHTEQRHAYQQFSDNEKLYRRVRKSDLFDGEINPLTTPNFARLVSTLRSNEAEPEDVLHPDCAEGQDRSDYIVISLPIAALPSEIKSDDGRIFEVFPNHQPEPTCYAHTNLWCIDQAIGIDKTKEILKQDCERLYASPPRNVRKKMRELIFPHLERH